MHPLRAENRHKIVYILLRNCKSDNEDHVSEAPRKPKKSTVLGDIGTTHEAGSNAVVRVVL